MNALEGGRAMAWLSPARLPGPACVFIDRDGVVNERPGDGWVLRWEDFQWRPDAFEAAGILTRARLPIVVVSNQSCVGRGLLSRPELERIMHRMTDAFERCGTPLAGWYCCPHAPDDGCDCRKPKPGMLVRGARECDCDLRRSIMIGDTQSDVDAGTAAGCDAVLINPSPTSFAAAATAIAARASRGPR